MRKNFLLISIALILTLTSSSVFAWDYGNPTKASDTAYESFGPRADELLIKMYASATYEWENGLEQEEIDVTDWPLDAPHYAEYTTAPLNSTIKSVSYGAEFSPFLFDLNNNNNEYLGNPPNVNYTNPVYPNPMSQAELRKAVAYLSDRNYVINEVIGKGLAYPLYTPVSTASGFYVHPEIKPGGSLESLCYLYNPAAAIAVLDASGKFPIGLDGWRYWDMNLNGVKDAGEDMTLKLFARNETSPRLKIAEKLYGMLENTTKIHVNWTPGNRAAATVQVFGNKDFHIYTAGWSLTMDPDHLVLWAWNYYWHPGQCYNTAGCNNPDFNAAADGVQYANTIEEATYWAHIAQVAFAENVLGVPLWSAGGSKAVSRTYVGPESNYYWRYWRGFVSIPGYGVDNSFTFLNMRTAGRSQGGTIRYGFQTTTISKLNPVYSLLWDNTVLDLIGYESLLTRDPYTRKYKPWLCDSFKVGTYEDGNGSLLTNMTFTMRRDAYWSDGAKVSFDDIEYTFVTMKDDLVARGFHQPWWTSNVQNIADIIQHSDTEFEIRLDSKSVFAVGWVGGNRILPKHIWEPICKGNPRPKDGAAWDPTTFAPDINLIHSGAWCFSTYTPGVSILLKAHKPGIAVTTSGISDPNWLASTSVASPYGWFRYYRDEDTTHDYKVNILDCIQTGNRFGATEGNPDPTRPTYNRRNDVNGDGAIDVLDAIRLASVFGWPNNELQESPVYPP
jgi:ABC-type transport system substrate-binding protein